MPIYTIFVVYLGQIFRCKTVFQPTIGIRARLIGSCSIIFDACICEHLSYGCYFFIYSGWMWWFLIVNCKVLLIFFLVSFLFFIRSNLYTQILNGYRFFMYFFLFFFFNPTVYFFFSGEEHVIYKQHHHYLDAHGHAWWHCEDTLYSQPWRRDHGNSCVGTKPAVARLSWEKTSSLRPHLASRRPGAAGARGHAWPRAGQGSWAFSARASALSAVRHLGRAHRGPAMAATAAPSSFSSVKKKGFPIGPVNFFLKMVFF